MTGMASLNERLREGQALTAVFSIIPSTHVDDDSLEAGDTDHFDDMGRRNDRKHGGERLAFAEPLVE